METKTKTFKIQSFPAFTDTSIRERMPPGYARTVQRARQPELIDPKTIVDVIAKDRFVLSCKDKDENPIWFTNLDGKYLKLKQGLPSRSLFEQAWEKEVPWTLLKNTTAVWTDQGLALIEKGLEYESEITTEHYGFIESLNVSVIGKSFSQMFILNKPESEKPRLRLKLNETIISTPCEKVPVDLSRVSENRTGASGYYYSIAELRSILSQLKLSTLGRKSDLAKRIIENKDHPDWKNVLVKVQPFQKIYELADQENVKLQNESGVQIYGTVDSKGYLRIVDKREPPVGDAREIQRGRLLCMHYRADILNFAKDLEIAIDPKLSRPELEPIFISRLEEIGHLVRL